MVNVHDWIGRKVAPGNPTKDDMRYGVGCLNDLLVTLSERMLKLLQLDGQFRNYNAKRILEEIEKPTFGQQMGIIKKHCKGFDITYDKMNLLRETRNYFDHNFNTTSYSWGDAHKLSEAINIVQKLIGQLDNANNLVTSKIRTSENIKGDALRKAIIEIVHKLPKDNDGDVRLSSVGTHLKNKKIKYEGKLVDHIHKFGWKTYTADDGKVHFLRVREIN